MADLFRSAFSYIQQAAPIRQSGIGLSGASHPLVGTTIDVGGIKVKLRSLLAEGGFGLVFSAEDAQGNLYALKRLLAADKEAADAAIREIKFQKELSGPPSIVRFVSAATRNPEQTSHGRAEFLLLTELCGGGPLLDLIQKGPISPENIIKIFYAASAAVKHMHDRNTPVTHRDIKIENLLFTSDGFIKLCDFGSATTEIWRPDDNWNALKRSLLEEEMQKHTTPMYRAPEILDTYQNYPIGPSQDIWALGCILFYLCYRTHPFEDSAKLRIINAKFVLPEEKTAYSGFHTLIKSLLQPNPHSRPSIQELCSQLEQLAYHLNIDLGKPISGTEFERQPSPATTPSQQPQQQRQQQQPSPPLGGGRRTPTDPSSTNQSQAGAGEMFAQLKGQGLSIFKNIRDKSAAVVQTVQTTYGSKGPDVTWITSRLIMAPMNENVPETIAQLSEEQMKNYIIDSSAKRQFVVFNLSERQLRCDYNRCSSEMPLAPISSGVAPSLDFMIGLCKNAVTFLRRDQRNMIFFTGSEAQCCLAVASLLLFCQHCDQAKIAVDTVRELRKSSTSFYFPSSYLRVLEVLATIVSCGNPDELRIMCHNAAVKINCIYMEPVPTFNNAKTGCRPFAEIYCGGKMLWSGFKTYEELKFYETKDRSISLDLGGWPVSEDVQIIVYHARWSSMQKRLQKVLIFGCGFHSNFIDGTTDHLSFGRDEIDTAIESQDGIPINFKALISLSVDPEDRGFRPKQLPEFLTYRREQVKEEWLIGCEDDELRLRQTISLVSSRPTRPPPPRPPPPGGVADGRSVPLIAPGSSKSSANNLNLDNPFESTGTAPKQEGFADFFSTLDWSSGQQQHQQSQQQQQFQEIIPPSRPAPPKHQQKQQYKDEKESAVDWERKAGIRIKDEEEDEDAHLYKFDYEKPKDIVKPSQPPADDTEKLIDDLDELLDFSGNSKPNKSSMAQQPLQHGTNNFLDDIFSSTSNSMHRNVSAPTFPNSSATTTKNNDDPFADMGLFKPTPKSEHGSGRSTPHNAAAGLPPMDHLRSKSKQTTATGANKGSGDIFADLLADHGITEKKKATMGEMIRTEENKFLDPVSIKIRNWTQNKNGNIRALLSSLDEVLWPEAGNWNVPSITDMLNDNVVKKVYFKACLLVHPDKQVNTAHHALAQAIFTELNKAMVAFENGNK